MQVLFPTNEKTPAYPSIWLAILATIFNSYAYAGYDTPTEIGILFDENTCDISEYRGMGFKLKAYPITSKNLKYYNEKINTRHGVNCVVDSILLLGPIAKNLSLTLRFLIKLVQSRGNVKWDGITLILDSPGGLIDEAIKMGDIIATTKIAAIVPVPHKCLSSCVLVLAASTTRMALGDIGIHRPFSYEVSTEDTSYDKYIAKYDDIMSRMAAYYKKFGVSQNIMDTISSIPSEKVKILDRKTLDDWGLGYKNVAYSEFNKAKEIKVCGKEYNELKTGFYAFLESCIARHQATIFDQEFKDCQALATKTYPTYSLEAKKCTDKKAK